MLGVFIRNSTFSKIFYVIFPARVVKHIFSFSTFPSTSVRLFVLTPPEIVWQINDGSTSQLCSGGLNCVVFISRGNKLFILFCVVAEHKRKGKSTNGFCRPPIESLSVPHVFTQAPKLMKVDRLKCVDGCLPHSYGNNPPWNAVHGRMLCSRTGRETQLVLRQNDSASFSFLTCILLFFSLP